MKKLSYIVKCFISLLFTALAISCINTFEPGNIKSTEGILVVEGAIIEPAGSFFKLSYTKSIKSKDDYTYVESATLKIICDDGSDIAKAHHTGEGRYAVTDEFTFKEGAKYAIHIQIGDKQYQSAFVKPVPTPELEEVSWTTKANGKEVDIRVSTHDPNNEVEYYRWMYKEDWEIVSPVEFETYYSTPTNPMAYRPGNITFCWDSDSTTSFVLGTTTKLSEKKLKDKVILNLKAGDTGLTRFSHLYSILVKQHGIDRETYDYFLNLQKNIEETGGIFAAQPSELEGNITCLSDENEIIIGYIYATKESAKRMYIDAEDVPDMREKFICEYQEFVNQEAAALINFFITVRFRDGRVGGFYIRCVDCAWREGTKNKPDFWPNDHI